MTSPRRFLRGAEMRPSKKLGQNFLTQPHTADAIVRWAGIQPGDHVLEIGPGLGALTKALLRAGAVVTAVEKDGRLFETLSEEMKAEPRLTIHHGDAIEVDYLSILKGWRGPWRVAANLPYSVSTPLIEALLNVRPRFSDLTLLLQEEVVDRIAAKVNTSDYGRLAIWVQATCETERGPRIARSNFHPVPKVESRLIRLTPLKNPPIPEADLEAMLALTAGLFQHRRKTIRNSLRDSGLPIERIDPALVTTGIDPIRRPQTLTIPELLTLSQALGPHS